MKRFVVDGQRVTPHSPDAPLAAHSVEFVELEFSFSPDWDGFVKTAQFTQNAKTFSVPLDPNARCFLPSGLDVGPVQISLFGQKPGKPGRATSVTLAQQILPSGFASDASVEIPPSPDLYALLLSKIESAEASTLSSRDDTLKAAETAERIQSKLQGLKANVETLPLGESPRVTVTETAEAMEFHFALPAPNPEMSLFDIDPATGELSMTMTADYAGPEFQINAQTGMLEVIIP